MPAATPMKKNARKSHGEVPSHRSSPYPAPAPITTARTNEMPTALSAPTVRTVRPRDVPRRHMRKYQDGPASPSKSEGKRANHRGDTAE